MSDLSDVANEIGILADRLKQSFVVDAMEGDGENLSDVLKSGTEKIAYQLKQLGKGDATDSRGAIEFLGIQIAEGFDRLASAVELLASAIARK